MREDQNDLWRFSTQVAGHWWERIRAGEDDKSAISYLTITVDELTNTPQLEGWAYTSKGEPMADWKTVVTGAILGVEPQIHYWWQGEEDRQHGQLYGGGGHIVFDDKTLNTARGLFYDTNGGQAILIARGLDRCG